MNIKSFNGIKRMKMSLKMIMTQRILRVSLLRNQWFQERGRQIIHYERQVPKCVHTLYIYICKNNTHFGASLFFDLYCIYLLLPMHKRRKTKRYQVTLRRRKSLIELQSSSNPRRQQSQTKSSFQQQYAKVSITCYENSNKNQCVGKFWQEIDYMY